MKVEDLNLHNETLQALNKNQFKATSFSKSVTDAVKSGKNLIIKSGETEREHKAFAVAAVDTLNSVKGKEGTKVIILSNRDENLNSIQSEINTLQPNTDTILIETTSNENAKIDEIPEGHSIVLANPGRLQSILKKTGMYFVT